MKKILIEFFDRENMNNCISQLHEDFDRIIYLYFEGDRCSDTENFFKALKEFNRRRAGVIPEFCPVSERDVDEIIGKLFEKINDEDVFVFDITGGPELFIMASGLFCGNNPDKNILIQQYDVVSGKKIVSFPKTVSDSVRNYTLSVRELIALHGSAITDGTVRYNTETDGLERNIIRMWETVRGCRSDWNKFCCLPNYKRESAGGTKFYKRTLTNSEKVLFNRITGLLVRDGLVSNIPSETVDGDAYSGFMSRMPENADILFEKSGNLLEMLTYLAVKRANAAADVLTGVPVDWDGIITGETGETRNEIDVIVSDGKIPIFISCKNRDVTNDFMYELKTVAVHYGGDYAKCILVSTSDNTLGMKKRAEAMDITLIDSISSMTTEQYFEKIREACFGGARS